MTGSEKLSEDIARIEDDIQELLDYRTEIDEYKQSVQGWARFVVSLKLLLVARQIERHLVFLKLERRIAQDTLRELEEAGAQNPAR